MIEYEWEEMTPVERDTENNRILEEVKALPLTLVIPEENPGPDGHVRSYPVFMDTYDILYDTPLPLNSMAKIEDHYNRTAKELNKPHRVRVVGGSLEFFEVVQ